MPKAKRRRGETGAEYRKRSATVSRAERETRRETAGEQMRGLGDVAQEQATGMEMPKQADYGSTSDWMAAVRKWRQRKRDKKKR